MQHSMATRVLDNGALGIVMPHVDTPEQAREIVDHLKYPPIGHRSLAGSQAIFDFKRIPIAEMIEAANAGTTRHCADGDPNGNRQCRSDRCSPGIDALLIGTNDLAAEMGIPGEYGHARVAGAYETVIAACRKHNKWPGMGGVDVEGLMQKYIGMGMQLVLTGSDGGFMMAGGGLPASRAGPANGVPRIKAKREGRIMIDCRQIR